MKRTLPGEIWRVDFGLAAKVRPALILSEFPEDDELALILVIPHTTVVQPMILPRFEMKLGALTESEFTQVKTAFARILKL